MTTDTSVREQAHAAPAATLWGTALLYAHEIANTAVSLCLTPFIAATLGRYHFGVWSLILSSTTMLAILDLGIGPATVKMASASLARANRQDLNRTMATAWHVTIGLSAAALLVAFGLLLAVDQFRAVRLTPQIRLAAFLVAVSIALGMLENSAASLLCAASRLRQLAIARLVSVAAYAVAVCLFLSLGYGLVGLAGAWIVGLAAKAACSFTFVSRTAGLGFLRARWFSRDKLRELSGFSFYTSLGSIAYLVVSNADHVILGGVAGAAALASYSATYRLPALGLRLLRLLAFALFPAFCRHHSLGQAAPSAQLQRLLVMASGGMAWAAAVLGVVAGREFIGAWISPDFFAGYHVLILSLLSMVAVAYISAAQTVGLAWGQVRTVCLLSAAEAALSLLLSLALVHSLGAPGVALATCLSQALFSLVVLPPLVCRLLRDSPRFYYASIAKGAALFALLAFLGRHLVIAIHGGLAVALATGAAAAALLLLGHTAWTLPAHQRSRLSSYARLVLDGLAESRGRASSPGSGPQL